MQCPEISKCKNREKPTVVDRDWGIKFAISFFSVFSRKKMKNWEKIR